MEQLDIKDMKIQQLEETIEKLKEENLNLKKIIMWQSYDRAGIKKDSKTIKLTPQKQ